MSSVWGTRIHFLAGTDDAAEGFHGPRKAAVQKLDSKLRALGESVDNMARNRPTDSNQRGVESFERCRAQIREVLQQVQQAELHPINVGFPEQESSNTRSFK